MGRMSDSASVLPALYRAWLEPLLGPIANEPRATCSKCAMANWPGQPPLERTFDANVKCCSYQPDVPSFLVGRILADDNPLGAGARSVIRQRIADRVGVTPLGIAMDPTYRAVYENAPSAFGKAMPLRCPYYVDQDGGLCGIWQHRESVCTTWFCKFERGAYGRIFWRVINSLLRMIEVSLRLWVMREVGLSEDAQVDLWTRLEYERGGRPPLDEHAMKNTTDPDRYRKDWANFLGREEEYFAKCAEKVQALTSDDILRIGGAVVQSAIHTARFAVEKLKNLGIPERSVPGPMAYFQIRKPGEVRVRHQGLPFDWYDIPESVATNLPRFERGPVREVLAALQAEGVPIDEAMVKKLVEWQVLNQA
jgi:hypothetical protein